MKPKGPLLPGEMALIEALSHRFGSPPAGVVLGIGDDCAAVALDGDDYLLWTVDTLLEGVHFDLAYMSLTQLGWKSLAVNLSDIAAMGGEPRYALLSLGWPKARDRVGALELADGLAQAARQYGVAVIGGDTVASLGGIMVTVSLLGVAPAGRMLRRAGARAGDLIYVTGPLGEAAAGLEVLKRGLEIEPELKAALCQAHLAPRPQLEAGRLLAENSLATAMIDTSDGVATDLFHLCRAGGVGARLREAEVPISSRVKAVAPYLGQDPLDLALKGGEDYQLLFTSTPQMASTLPQTFSQAGLPLPLFLGEIVAGERVALCTATGEVDISGQGFDHFRLDLKEEEI